MESLAVDGAGDDEGEELLAGPQWLGLQDGGHRQLAVPAGQEHEQGHHQLLLQEHVALGHLTHGAEGVLGWKKIIK